MQQVLHNDVQEVKSGLLKVEEDVEYLKLKSDEHGEMLRQILGLLKPEK
ncbi:MAG TPA: hypothetical protein VN207_08515 [Ktedonobacteraceae bacterium]|nr:hypothetical protein [Ktedonobacteraceae bacterium]